MEKNRVKLNICGAEYVIVAEDDAEYMESLGKELDEKMTQFMRTNSRLSMTQVAVLSALECLDIAKKSEESAENLRAQIKDYLEDAAAAKTEAEVARREADRLAKSLADLQNK